MITLKKYISILLILIFLFSGCIGQGTDQRPEKVSTLVREASVLVQEKGEEAFPQIREKGKFYTDDTYVFVWKVEGDKITRVVFPPDLAQEGTDVSDYKDDNNVSITSMFVTIANSEKGEGWSGEYLRTNPADNKIEKKVTYIKKVVYNDTTYVLGAGYYIN
ncbi:MAG TPA: cache domain-containing protein [Methanofastidiosum sp.]|nr:cache domain-containing protein [Methanofastidiosum sp.]